MTEGIQSQHAPSVIPYPSVSGYYRTDSWGHAVWVDTFPYIWETEMNDTICVAPIRRNDIDLCYVDELTGEAISDEEYEKRRWCGAYKNIEVAAEIASSLVFGHPKTPCHQIKSRPEPKLVATSQKLRYTEPKRLRFIRGLNPYKISQSYQMNQIAQTIPNY